MNTRTQKFSQWLNESAYIGKGITEGTVKDAMLHFFYQGVSPWIQGFGYSWSQSEDCIARKFVRACYDIASTSLMDSKYTLEAPEPRHRNLVEDRDTFDFLVDTQSFVELLEEWECYDQVVGTRLDFLLREFCYVWINVESGQAGTRTMKILEADTDNGSDDDRNGNIPDGNWSRRKHDLY